ncbi:hypothetical protein BDV34DRAFT_212665 [Aspergillus parasiticus]|uniref:Uncharacterized protein n=1 Tax=Aspergillus parasiticus TaxID=5067 RepID=A0A5N6DPC7_ASPPA|nr:hypothetical protein BDV34DRAFT_212665 [Aspergillus parasiticus]
MAPLLAPYNSSMRLGSGFNSYTQQPCVDDAVKKGNVKPPELSQCQEGVAQSVVFKTSIIDKMSEITDALNISGALTIKYNNLIDGTGKGSFINSNKLKDADINFLISVKVINQTVTDNGLTEFSPIQNLDPSRFTEVYGDTFISGFQEGGEFNAVVSIKVKDKNQLDTIKADAAVALTTPSFGTKKPKTKKTKKLSAARSQKNEQPRENKGGEEEKENEAKGEEEEEEDEEDEEEEDDDDDDDDDSPAGLAIKGNARVAKNLQDIFHENETTVSVSWSGGGQELKKPNDDWNIRNLRAAALRFPALVAKTPVRTYAVLTRYTALKSFHAQTDSKEAKGVPLSYDNASVYTSVLQDAFMDYKNIYKDIRFSEADLDFGKKKFKESTFKESTFKESTLEESTLKESKAKASTNSGRSIYNSRQACANDAESNDPTATEAPPAHIATKPFAPTLAGFELAKVYIRRNMNMIVKEVDEITKKPELASQDRALPFQSPIIFKQYLPVQV